MVGKFSDEQLAKYTKAGYKVVGENNHSGVQLCRWAKSSLRGERNCYKSFYGVDAHRCLQITPALNFCTFSCKFCWRNFREDRNKAAQKWDSPSEILEGLIAGQRKLISGFGGNKKTTKERYNEAFNPKHVAISLDGEPTLYPHIAGLIREIRARGMTSFLVTNGSVPTKIKELFEKDAQPDNLYISVYATNSEDYNKITNSLIGNPFERVLESLNLLKKFDKSRKVFRMTLVKDENIGDSEGYAKLAKMAEPDFIEMKGYSWLGESKERLAITNMPRMEDIDNFASLIEKNTGYILKFRDVKSRVVILCKDEKTFAWSQEKIKEQNARFEKNFENN